MFLEWKDIQLTPLHQEFMLQLCYTKIALGWIGYSMALVLKTQWTVRFFAEMASFPLTFAQHEWSDQMLFDPPDMVHPLCCSVKKHRRSRWKLWAFWLCCEQVVDKDCVKCLIQQWLHILLNCVDGLWSLVQFRFLTLEKKR